MIFPLRSYALRLLFVVALCPAACGVGAVNNASPGVVAQPTSHAPETSPAAAAPAAVGTPATPAASVPGQAQFNGTVAGVTLTPRNALFALATQNGMQILAVKISDQSDDCAEVTKNAHHPNATSFWLRASGTSFANMTFTLAPDAGDGSTSTADFYQLDARCRSALSSDQSSATDGMVAFTMVDATHAMGTFSATVGSQQDTVSGTFSAVACPALSTLITAPDTERTCQ